jgi:hypothetical protein
MTTPKITLALAFGLLVGLSSCNEVTGNADNRFVALEALLDEQVRLLESANPAVKKSVLAAGGTQEKTFRDVDWQKELAAFRQADLGKPGLRGAYTVQDVAPNVRVFRVKPGENSEVQEVRVEFAEGNRVRSVQALVNDENYLYHTRRTFRIDFAPAGTSGWCAPTASKAFRNCSGTRPSPSPYGPKCCSRWVDIISIRGVAANKLPELIPLPPSLTLEPSRKGDCVPGGAGERKLPEQREGSSPSTGTGSPLWLCPWVSEGGRGMS